jgi:hypothetical protein
MTAQPALFQAPTACPVGDCQAIRGEAQDKVITCRVDLDRATGEHRKRPAACLNAHDPSKAELPY